MREEEFKAWLGQRRYQGKPLKTITNRVGWVKAVERALPELGFSQSTLDDIYYAGEWDVLLKVLSDLRADWHKNEAAAQRIAPQSTDPHLQVANARQAAGMYGRFLEGDDPNYDADAEEGEAMTDETILAPFTRKSEFAQWWQTWPTADREAFFRIVRVTHEAGLDWYHLKMTHEVRCGRKKIGAIDANEVYAQISGKAPYGHIRKEPDRGALGVMDDWISLTAFAEALEAAPEALARFNIERDGYWPDQINPDSGEPAEIYAAATDPTISGSDREPTNLILYGPPGTGKTYATAEEAVKICDGSAPTDRSALMTRYRELVEARRIDFVTFHQSYSYEEFVEGLRPHQGGSNADGTESGSAGFTLMPEDGVFRRISHRAAASRGGGGEFVVAERQVFKLSIGEVANPEDDYLFDEALAEGHILLGYDDIDWSDERFAGREAMIAACRDFDQQHPKNHRPEPSAHTGRVQCPLIFRNWIKRRDLVIVSKGNSRFRAIGEVTGDYEFAPREGGTYAHRRSVNWLWIDKAGAPVDDIYGKNFSMRAVYELTPGELNIRALESYISGQLPGVGPAKPEPYVLIIDEINRGNISKIFGELITLIEPDKRAGMQNAVEVRLPYSKEPFSVPANLHLIGTMNTADRSIALLDTALRRRFRFKELAPDTRVNAFQSAVRATGIPLDMVLDTINDRIEYFIDREHRIGHAFFIGCRDRASVNAIMRDKVIPLLQEYFFEDWGRVAAVLGERPERGGAFLDCRKLGDPTGNDGEPRLSWSLRPIFAQDAYARLISRAPREFDEEPAV